MASPQQDLNFDSDANESEGSSDGPEIDVYAYEAEIAAVRVAAAYTRRFPADPHVRDPEIRPEIRGYLMNLADGKWITGFRARSWGYVVFRISYEDDGKFNAAIDTIYRYVQLWCAEEAASVTEQLERLDRWNELPEGMPVEADLRPNEELMKRFGLHKVQDRKRLDGATEAEVCRYFQKWANEHSPYPPGHHTSNTPWLKSAILLDAETINQLLRFPADIPLKDLYRVADRFWVKIVESHPYLREGYEGEGLVRCYHLRLNALVSFWFRRDFRNPAIFVRDDSIPGVQFYSE